MGPLKRPIELLEVRGPHVKNAWYRGIYLRRVSTMRKEESQNRSAL